MAYSSKCEITLFEIQTWDIHTPFVASLTPYEIKKLHALYLLKQMLLKIMI